MPYLIRVNPIVKYLPAVDSGMVPVAEVPPQDVTPWQALLARLTTDKDHWEQIARASRKAALEYAANLNVLPFESFLLDLIAKPKRHVDTPAKPALSDEKKRLLTLRLKQRAPAKPDQSPWLPGIEQAGAKPRLFCLPWAGGGALPYRAWREPLQELAAVVGVRQPGRETRATEPAFVRMEPLVEALLAEVRRHADAPFHFFGHSMGAGIAFELTRTLRREGLPLPLSLHVSGARAPQYRLNHQPPPEPSMRDFIEELRRLEGFPPSVLNNPELLKLALPALLSDARLYRHYRYLPEDPLPVPLFAYGGEADPNITSEQLSAWGAQTTAPFHLREFHGGHFYLETSQAALLAALKSDLMRVSPAR